MEHSSATEEMNHLTQLLTEYNSKTHPTTGRALVGAADKISAATMSELLEQEMTAKKLLRFDANDWSHLRTSLGQRKNLQAWVNAQAEQVVIDNEELYHMEPPNPKNIWVREGGRALVGSSVPTV